MPTAETSLCKKPDDLGWMPLPFRLHAADQASPPAAEFLASSMRRSVSHFHKIVPAHFRSSESRSCCIQHRASWCPKGNRTHRQSAIIVLCRVLRRMLAQIGTVRIAAAAGASRCSPPFPRSGRAPRQPMGTATFLVSNAPAPPPCRHSSSQPAAAATRRRPAWPSAAARRGGQEGRQEGRRRQQEGPWQPDEPAQAR